MSDDPDQPPAKRQRFFVDEPAALQDQDAASHDASLPRHCPGLEGHGLQQDGEGDVSTEVMSQVLGAACHHIIRKDTPLQTTETTEPEPTEDLEQASSTQNGTTQESSDPPSVTATRHAPGVDGFDIGLFTSIIGEQLPPDSIHLIRSAAANNIERAVNVYFDGSWKKPPTTSSKAVSTFSTTLPVHPDPSAGSSTRPPRETHEGAPADHPSLLRKQPSLRYIGAFGVGGWATRSGPTLLKHGDLVKIERARSQPTMKRGRGGKVYTNNKTDILTRFTNSSGQEIGRLPHETAGWVSSLIDQKLCHFEGVCVYIPDRVRVNDTIYLQLRCYFRREAFQRGPFVGSDSDDNRSTGLFEDKESTEEKNLRLRQVALVKLFHEIGLQPTSINPTTEKHKRDGLLRAAEMAEQYDGVKKEKTKPNKDSNDDSSEEDTTELEEDQLDTLYRKAQSFDFNMPEADPAPTFTMSLRKYQKQALYWMLSKEKDKKQARERSMHPLWEEYTWPSKDADD